MPLVYPVLAYLLRAHADRRLPAAAARGAAGPAACRSAGSRSPPWSLAVFRIGLNVADSQVIDIGFAGVVGADRIADGDGVYDGDFTPLIDAATPTGRPTTSPTCRSSRSSLGRRPRGAAGRPRRGDRLRLSPSSGCCCSPAAPARGRRGPDLGIALAFAWLAYPYTLYALNANGGNDALVARAARRRADRFASPLERGAGDRRSAPPSSSGRWRSRRCSPPAPASGACARRCSSRPPSSPSGPSSCCRCCPTAASASSTTAPSATRPRAARRSASGAWSRRWRSLQTSPGPARAARLGALLHPAAADAAAGRRARRRGPDRHPGRRRRTGSTSSSSGGRPTCWSTLVRRPGEVSGVREPRRRSGWPDVDLAAPVRR